MSGLKSIVRSIGPKNRLLFFTFLLTIVLVHFVFRSSQGTIVVVGQNSENGLKEVSGSKIKDIFESELDQDDPLILNYVLKNHLYPPNKNEVNSEAEKGLKGSQKFPSLVKGISKIEEILKKRNGFFIEVGANDGVFLSNTINLEVARNWTGLLIEASPALFAKLRTSNRNAWMSDVCLTGNRPERIEFLKKKDTYGFQIGMGRINPGKKYKKPATVGKEVFRRKNYESEGIVDCVPLYSLLSAINVSHVDYFSLDIEGHEYKVLQAIPYDRLQIDVIQLEYYLAPEGKDAIKDLLLSKGYALIKETDADFLFLKQ